MINPLISVIIPIYNAEDYLEETILSVLNQTYQNFELLLVNHNSSDKSPEIIKAFKEQDNRIKIINLSINKGGPAYPRNEGIKVAEGEYIAFLDSDDVWLEKKLERQISILLENNNYDFIDSNAYTIDEESIKIGVLKIKRVYNILKFFLNKKNILIFSNFININTILIKNSNLPKFREDNNLIAIEDWLFWIENILDNKKVYLCDEYLIQYRIVNSSISNRLSDKRYRKIFYMYSLLFLESKISLSKYLSVYFFNFLKLTKYKIL